MDSTENSNEHLAADLISRRRNAIGYSRAKIAEIAGISEDTVKELENGERVNVEVLTIVKLSVALNFDPELLVYAFARDALAEAKKRNKDLPQNVCAVFSPFSYEEAIYKSGTSPDNVHKAKLELNDLFLNEFKDDIWLKACFTCLYEQLSSHIDRTETELKDLRSALKDTQRMFEKVLTNSDRSTEKFNNVLAKINEMASEAKFPIKNQ